jgi:protein-tyrosine-phosphatase
MAFSFTAGGPDPYGLVSKPSGSRLSRLPDSRAVSDDGRPEVLFVCVHNAGRSQMAASLLDRAGGGRLVVRSAGSEPADVLNPAVVEALDEIGLDVSREFPKPLTTDAVKAADVVITMGCGDACPVFPGKRYEDWELEDPAGKELPTVRQIRDDIAARVDALAAELIPPTTHA